MEEQGITQTCGGTSGGLCGRTGDHTNMWRNLWWTMWRNLWWTMWRIQCACAQAYQAPLDSRRPTCPWYKDLDNTFPSARCSQMCQSSSYTCCEMSRQLASLPLCCKISRQLASLPVCCEISRHLASLSLCCEISRQLASLPVLSRPSLVCPAPCYQCSLFSTAE